MPPMYLQHCCRQCLQYCYDRRTSAAGSKKHCRSLPPVYQWCLAWVNFTSILGGKIWMVLLLHGDLSSCITTGSATVFGGIWEPEFTYTYLFCPNFLFVCFCKEHGKETKSLLCIYQTLLVRTLHHVHVHVDITFTLHLSCKSLILKYAYEII